MADISTDTVLATGTTTAQVLATAFADFGSIKGFGDTSVADDTAIFQAAINALDYIDIPPGNYSVSTVNIPSNKIIVNRGSVQGTFQIAGSNQGRAGIYYTNQVLGLGSLVAGVTSFSGNFTGYNVGDFVIIGLQGLGLAAVNQSGFDFGTVTVAGTSTSVTIDTPTRWGYPAWFVAKTVGVKVTGTFNQGIFSIAGNYTTQFAVGDVIRIENIGGNDNWFGKSGQTPLVAGGDKAYFELVKVKSITTSAIVFEQELAYNYIDIYLIKMNVASNVTISGGYIQNIAVTGSEKLRLFDLNVANLSVAYSLGFEVDQIRADGNGPTTCGFTSSRDGVISNIVTRGATGSSDNGGLKMMSNIAVSVTNIRSYDTNATAQGSYPFFADFYFTPYASWGQQLSLGQFVLSKPKAGATYSLWLVGQREIMLSNINVMGDIKINQCSGITATGINGFNSVLNLSDLLNGGIISSFRVALINVIGVSDYIFTDGHLRGANGSNAGRTIWLRGGATPTTTKADRNKFSNIVNHATTATDVTFYLQAASDNFIEGCVDSSGLAKSVQIQASSGVGNINYGLNSLKNLIDADVLANTNGKTLSASDVQLYGSTWNRARMILGANYLWVDSTGKLRIKNSAPTSDTDGVVVGSQT
jgi:hypothetical protein